MAATFWKAHEVESYGIRLIAEHHRHLQDLRVEYVFRSDVPLKGDQFVLGTARKISSLNAYLAGQRDDEGSENESFFVITISEPAWKKLDERARTALVDHELAHCWREDDDDGNPMLRIMPHDLEEFKCIYARYGDWKPEIAAWEKLFQERQLQTTLDLQPRDETEASMRDLRLGAG